MKRWMLVVVMVLATGCAKWRNRHHNHLSAPTTEPATDLEPGLGNHYHPTSSTNPRAQRFFDQGLTLYYAFNHEASIRAFKRAAQLDPDFAMAHWGVALALGPNYNDPSSAEKMKMAAGEIQTATRLAQNAPQQERYYIAALSTRYSEDPKFDMQQLGEKYASAMRDLMKRYPYDTDAATLFAEAMMDLRPWKLYNGHGQPEPGTDEIVAVLEDVLTRDPDHIGANHYYIHAVEASDHPERAIPSARRLPHLAPGAGHLVHMPAHIYQRTGDYDLAAKANEQAAVADQVYLKNHPEPGIYGMMYYSHNLHFAAISHATQGRWGDAHDYAKQLMDNIQPHMKEMPMLEGFAVTPALVAVRCARWSDIMSIPAPPQDQPRVLAVYHFARGMALACNGVIEGAERERDAMVAAKKQVPADSTFGLANAQDVLLIAQHLLEARILASNKDDEAAMALLKRAVKEEDRLPYDEPPPWFIPIREALGGAQLNAREFVAAEQTFREDLDKHPRSGRSLFGLAEALKNQNRRYEAEFVTIQYQQAWEKAERPLRRRDLW